MGLTRLLLASAVLALAVLLNGCGGGGSNGNSNGPLSITTSTAPQGVVGGAYNLTLGATGGTMPYAWGLGNGICPAGLTWSRAGVISGTPSAAGAPPFTAAVTDSEHPPG